MKKNLFVAVGFAIVILLFAIVWGRLCGLEQKINIFAGADSSANVVYTGTITPGEDVVEVTECDEEDIDECRYYTSVSTPGLDVEKMMGIVGLVKNLEDEMIWSEDTPDFQDGKVWYSIGNTDNGEENFYEAFDYKIIVSY